MFTFYEKIFYLDHEDTFPSTNEKVGYWLGVTHNFGDALMYKILMDDKAPIISCSIVCPANDKKCVTYNSCSTQTLIPLSTSITATKTCFLKTLRSTRNPYESKHVTSGCTNLERGPNQNNRRILRDALL